MTSRAKIFVGCGITMCLSLCAVIALVVWLMMAPESGVRLKNEMDQHSWKHLQKHKVLEPGEDLIAYYDVTISSDGTEAAILTDQRVIYHKDAVTVAIPLNEVEDIRHRTESLIGDIIEIDASKGRAMKIEIAPFNQGETFKRALLRAWRNAKGAEVAPG